MTKTERLINVVAQTLGQEKRDYLEILANWLPELERDMLIEQIYQTFKPYIGEVILQTNSTGSKENATNEMLQYQCTSQDIMRLNDQFDELTKHYRDKGIWAWNIVEENVPLDIDNLNIDVIRDLDEDFVNTIEIPEALDQAAIWKRISRAYRRKHNSSIEAVKNVDENHDEHEGTDINSSRIWHRIRKNLSSFDRSDTVIKMDKSTIHQPASSK